MPLALIWARLIVWSQLRGGKPELLPLNPDGRDPYLVPSVFALDDGQLLTGQSALKSPSQPLRSLKRLMGRILADPITQAFPATLKPEPAEGSVSDFQIQLG